MKSSMRKWRLSRIGPIVGVTAFGFTLQFILDPDQRGPPHRKRQTDPNAVPHVVVYQYQACPYCYRVKSYLDFLRIPYKTVEVNPITKSQLFYFKDYQKVPIAVLNMDIVYDSNNIIDAITKNHSTGRVPSGFYPPDTQKWNEWSEKRLAVYIYPNLCRTFADSSQFFSYAYAVPTWSYLEQGMVHVLGTLAGRFASGKVKSKYNIVDERKELNDEVQVWLNAVGDKKFLHGNQITMPDVLVYGVLKSVEGMNTFTDVMDKNPKLRAWYERVASVVNPPK